MLVPTFKAWVMLVITCFFLASCGYASHPPREVAVHECGRSWSVSVGDVHDFRAAVRLDCGFLRPRGEANSVEATVGPY
jgi:hypothetical protein